MKQENNNKILIHGRLGQNPDLRYTLKQEPVCMFSIAENKQLNAEPIWHRIVVWGKQAEYCSVHLKKGQQVFVKGTNVNKEFKNKNGETKSLIELRADLIGFIFT